MHALAIIGGLIGAAIFATLLAAYHAKRALPEGETRNEVQAVAQSGWWWPVTLAPVVAAVLLIAGKSGWL